MYKSTSQKGLDVFLNILEIFNFCTIRRPKKYNMDIYRVRLKIFLNEFALLVEISRMHMLLEAVIII